MITSKKRGRRKGYKHSKETIEKIKNGNVGKKKPTSGHKRGTMLGEENPNWKGGVTPKNASIRSGIEYRLWREAVFARDNWTCRKCKAKGVFLNAHHIKPFAKYPELRTAIDNGLTVCKPCHKVIHQVKH